MSKPDFYLKDSSFSVDPYWNSSPTIARNGGLFLDQTVPNSFVQFISLKGSSCCSEISSWNPIRIRKSESCVKECYGGGLLSLSLKDSVFVRKKDYCFVKNVEERSDEGRAVVLEESHGGAVNTTKHLWAGAIAAMVSS